MKRARVSPILRKSNRHTTSNYRPISLIAGACKAIGNSSVEQSLIICVNKVACCPKPNTNSSEEHLALQTSLKFSRRRHRYWTRRPVLASFIRRNSPHTSAEDNGSSLHIISNLVMNQSSFSGRRQGVIINSTASAWAEVTCGISHGTVLSPILFTIYLQYKSLILKTQGPIGRSYFRKSITFAWWYEVDLLEKKPSGY